MRILMIHERYQQHGGEDAVFDTESALLEAAGCEVERLIVDNRQIAHKRAGLSLAANALWSPSGRAQVAKAVGTFKPDVTHVHNWFPLLSPAIHSAIRTQGVPVVQTLHNFRLMCLNGLFFRDGAPCEDCLHSVVKWKGIARRCYRDDAKASAAVAAMDLLHWGLGTWRRHVDQFLTYSDFSRQRFIAAGLPADRIAVTHNAVPDPGGAAASWDRPRMGAVYIGRLSAEKGIETLVRAWRGIGHRLSVVGDGPLAPQLQAEASDEVSFLGWRDQGFISHLLSQSQLACIPSHCYEQQPRVIAEAAAHGVPVLASDHGGMHSFIQNGITGQRTPPGNADAWRQAAINLLGHPDHLAAMGAANREIYLTRHCPDAVVGQRIALYSRLKAISQ